MNRINVLSLGSFTFVWGREGIKLSMKLHLRRSIVVFVFFCLLVGLVGWVA